MGKYMKKITIKIPKWLIGTAIHLIIIICFLILGYNLPDWINNKANILKFLDILIIVLIMFTISSLLNYIYEIAKSIVLDNKPVQFYGLTIKLQRTSKKETNVGEYR